MATALKKRFPVSLALVDNRRSPQTHFFQKTGSLAIAKHGCVVR